MFLRPKLEKSMFIGAMSLIILLVTIIAHNEVQAAVCGTSTTCPYVWYCTEFTLQTCKPYNGFELWISSPCAGQRRSAKNNDGAQCGRVYRWNMYYESCVWLDQTTSCGGIKAETPHPDRRPTG